MTEDEIKEGNNLIKEFMEYVYIPAGKKDNFGTLRGRWVTKCNLMPFGTRTVLDFQKFEFNESWDWIMPVVDKICDYEVVGDFHICGSTVLIISAIKCDDNPVSDIEIWHSGGDDKKRAVFEACVKFIKQIK